MRPFYEQYHYDRRPRSLVGDTRTKEFVSDFLEWLAESTEQTPHVVSGKTHHTAFSALNPNNLLKRSRRGINGFFQATGVWPGFVEPRTFGATNILHSLLMPFPKKSPADKLLVPEFIPKEYRDRVKAATVVGVWSSHEDISFDGIKPGKYFFKSNDGSDQNIPLTLPCSDEELAHVKAKAKSWLETIYGQNSCQWWYAFIDSKVFLEKDLRQEGEDVPIVDFRFHVVNGTPVLLQMDTEGGEGVRNNPVYDKNLNYLPYDFLRSNTHEEPLPSNAQFAQEVATKIGKAHQYCRVDLYLKGEEVFLGEMTFLPNSGRRRTRAPEIDELFSDHWKEEPPRVVRVE
ncbi:ATP-grasp fold amidoligase family protein [Octadecabacter ascidiaceicola]|uniref:TupA-like ATPgrasp n=1 Tax=Octadecabacter ascidiaceicola TaxID=1655543 RepID=A0A238JK23_9RHOB|nr:ATP-grasp fold amidoligase family protein [Octadecabacter ascidiaceicola]SMX30753.1 hypothetical protein OCA8868_00011 [Octadecabacter ascidiaceicola]